MLAASRDNTLVKTQKGVLAMKAILVNDDRSLSGRMSRILS